VGRLQQPGKLIRRNHGYMLVALAPNDDNLTIVGHSVEYGC
jgi:hypothetical protein